MATQRELLKKEVWRRLGGGMVDVELTADHYDDALDFAIATYRQRSSNSVSERFTFVELQPDQDKYILPEEIIEVRQIFRFGNGGIMTGQATQFEPFAAAIANQTLLGTGSIPSLTTYELFTGFQELVGKMFGFYIIFTWNPTEHRIDLARRPLRNETVLLWVYETRPDEVLLSDPYARPWLLRFTVSQCKIMLGEARSRFGNFVGPQGGTTLNGQELKTEGQAEMEALFAELNNLVEQNFAHPFIIG